VSFIENVVVPPTEEEKEAVRTAASLIPGSPENKNVPPATAKQSTSP
jgi:hypothetical protein